MARSLLAAALLLLPLAFAGEEAPRPADLAHDLTEWPNRESWRNSDPWIAEHHRELRRMRPRVLVLVFANDVSLEAVRAHAAAVVSATAESTRFHGFEDPAAEPFLCYEPLRFVDLRDPPGPEGPRRVNSSAFPRKATGATVLDYAALYGRALAERIGIADPRDPARALDLHELIQLGFVHELWLYLIHEPGDRWPALETCEVKQHYDAQDRPIPGKHGPSGNGHDDSMPWSGRSFRIAFFNPHRGPGCAMENYGHTLEATANWGAVPAYKRWFDEFAELDLKRRFGLPFDSLYALGGADRASYPAGALEVTKDGEVHRASPYVARGGNVHFPPGATRHYDLWPAARPLSTIERWRQGGGEGGADLARPIDPARWRPYERLAPDGMGPWTVYWRQCMPGPGGECKDDQGRPLKSWWPYLFY